ncbi:hypothetical protein [Sediminibacillus albus]|uniref:Uncharacterized protein n=1 Tax=Sediminibacillus albus TaxID=407036 RepID=A0A1G8Y387_9BACI|nr:hypothetical protein [Sediminibacillus albus]SDJ97266.1 hypothetical protein SAMN05216243_1381 [Sediminibacillus albus]
MDFELSFKNKQVRAWFIVVVPIAILAVILLLVLPRELHFIPTFLSIIANLIYVVWLMIDIKRKGTSEE